ncbi:MAG: BirA family biotin operon repressor/biotin-[acetyl-CoA-carboxylase] ligase [Arenicella sp.]|jgi:BirA family biotin operon repressor/biotin-[acetyl-CoA-carboxylase] ligase
MRFDAANLIVDLSTSRCLLLVAVSAIKLNRSRSYGPQPFSFCYTRVMQNQDTLIELLNRPGSVSGTLIGEILGISRMAVQKRIQALVENGLPIEAVSGKGYTLADGICLLSDRDIAAHLDPAYCESVEVLQSIESTNSFLLGQEILNGKAKLCIAEAQSAGRGRRGNDWQSAPYRNVMLSISWGFDHWPETITGLGLAVALCVVETINDSYGLDVKIKWPNDLLLGENKLAGILIDVAGESSGACNVVIGLGLNVHQPDWSASDSTYRWSDLDSLGVLPNRNDLIGRVANSIIAMLGQFSDSGFSPLVDRWNASSSYSGRRVTVGNDDELIEGIMTSVDSVGALLIIDDNGCEHRFADSNVSVRLVVSQ